jgi:hypothetical protein
MSCRDCEVQILAASQRGGRDPDNSAGFVKHRPAAAAGRNGRRNLNQGVRPFGAHSADDPFGKSAREAVWIANHVHFLSDLATKPGADESFNRLVVSAAS